MTRARTDALLILNNPLTVTYRRQIAQLAISRQLPTVCEERMQALEGHTWPRPPLHRWGIAPTHLNLFQGYRLPRAMRPKCLTYKTRIWAIMLKNFHISRPNGE